DIGCGSDGKNRLRLWVFRIKIRCIVVILRTVMWVSGSSGVCLPTFWVFGWKTNTARVYTGCVPADARTQKQKRGLSL
ncbi:hypothetical protein, partial [Rothia aeria]|uniref:hypothetical protein n=1 Tax=Rothia aeria TaxID=172042 RepID=UPI003C7B19EA